MYMDETLICGVEMVVDVDGMVLIAGGPTNGTVICMKSDGFRRIPHSMAVRSS